MAPGTLWGFLRLQCLPELDKDGLSLEQAAKERHEHLETEGVDWKAIQIDDTKDAGLHENMRDIATQASGKGSECLCSSPAKCLWRQRGEMTGGADFAAKRSKLSLKNL